MKEKMFQRTHCWLGVIQLETRHPFSSTILRLTLRSTTMLANYDWDQGKNTDPRTSILLTSYVTPYKKFALMDLCRNNIIPHMWHTSDLEKFCLLCTYQTNFFLKRLVSLHTHICSRYSRPRRLCTRRSRRCSGTRFVACSMRAIELVEGSRREIIEAFWKSPYLNVTYCIDLKIGTWKEI